MHARRVKTAFRTSAGNFAKHRDCITLRENHMKNARSSCRRARAGASVSGCWNCDLPARIVTRHSRPTLPRRGFARSNALFVRSVSSRCCTMSARTAAADLSAVLSDQFGTGEMVIISGIIPPAGRSGIGRSIGPRMTFSRLRSAPFRQTSGSLPAVGSHSLASSAIQTPNPISDIQPAVGCQSQLRDGDRELPDDRQQEV